MTTNTTFLGLGAMGSALAAAAVDAGRPAVVWNRTPHRARALGERGATVAGSVEEAVAGDGVIVACLFDHRSVHGVLDPVVGDLSGRFAERQAPFLAAMTAGLAGLAARIDAKDYTGEGQQSLRFTETALAALMRASADEGVNTEVLKPVHDIVRRQIAAGFGEQGTARIFEGLRSTR